MTRKEEEFRNNLKKSYESALRDARTNNGLYSPLVMAGILSLIVNEYDQVLLDKYGQADFKA